MRHYLLALFLITSMSAPAQLLQIGTIDTLYSGILGEPREIYLQLPPNYETNPRQHFPVVYLLDGEALLDAVTTVHNYYWGGFMPQMIIVGISNAQNRMRDLTTSKTGIETEHGESEQFRRFIAQELIPYIDDTYRATSYRTLIGHSYGGLFTVHTLLHHQDMFSNYLAIDPSLDWDDQELLRHGSQLLETGDYAGNALFMSLSGQLHMADPLVTIDNVMQDTTRFTIFARSNIAFRDLINQHAGNGLRSGWKFYARDIHGTVPLPSILDGLIFLFEWFQMEQTDKINDPETPVDELVELVRYRENKLKQHFGYPVPPFDQELLNVLGHMSLDMGQPEKSRAYFQFNLQYYPDSPDVFDAMADYHAAQQDYAQALEFVTRAFQLSGADDHKKKMVEFQNKLD